MEVTLFSHRPEGEVRAPGIFRGNYAGVDNDIF